MRRGQSGESNLVVHRGPIISGEKWEARGAGAPPVFIVTP